MMIVSYMPILKLEGDKRSFNVVKKKADIGDTVLIIQGRDKMPFNDKHIGHCFKVYGRCDSDEFEAGVFIHIGDMNWMLYDDQYLTLQDVKHN